MSEPAVQVPYGFVLVTSDPMMSGSTTTGSAYDLVQERLRVQRWPLYEGTRNRDRIKEAARVAFYIAGKKTCGGCLIASAIVREVVRPRNRPELTDPPQYLTDPPAVVLELDEIRYYDPPISFLERLPRLSFCPANLKNWGSSLQGGTRSLSEGDWKTLLQPTTPLPSPISP